MNNLDIIIKNGTLIIGEPAAKKIANSFSQVSLMEVKAHVGIKDGKIKYIGTENIPANQIIDAKGLHILPGIIDSQVHFREPGMIHKEDLSTGTQAAAMGGITSVFEMPNTIPPTTTIEHFQDKLSRAQKKAWVNYAFYIGASHENVSDLKNLELLPHCSGIKIFVGSSTGSLLVEDEPTLEKIFTDGKRRIIVHSEDENRLKERKQIAIDSKDVKNHPIWRDELTALNSTQRLVAIAEKTGRPLHVLHVTSAEEMELLHKKQKTMGEKLSVEILPQHLLLAAPECYERLGTLAQQNPPIRDKRHQEALWKGLTNGTVTVMGSDHAPHTLEEKKREYPNSPSGMPGVQTMLPIMLNFVNQEKLSLFRLVELFCENPRKVFGCNTKGRIALGFDADLTIIDLKKTKTIENRLMKSRCGWTPFDGMKITGWPKITLIGGIPVMQEDQLLGLPIGKPVTFDF